MKEPEQNQTGRVDSLVDARILIDKIA